jgi:multidrug resistance efflux pump
MVTAIVMAYSLFLWLVFAKLKWVKPSPESIGAAVAIGVLLIGSIFIGWRFSAPYSNSLVVARYAVEIVPQVRGPIESIHAKPMEPLKGGESILFEIQKEPFQYAVDQSTAELGSANQIVLQAEAAIRAADAGVASTEANLVAAKAAMEIAEKLKKKLTGAVSELDVVQSAQQYKAALAAVEQARATVEESKYALNSAERRVESSEAQLQTTRFNLQQCTVRAPSDGFVVNWQAREGSMTASTPISAVGTFVDTTEVLLAAAFPQNTLEFVQTGDPVEISLKSHPGQIFTGEVEYIIKASGEGQFVTGGKLPSASSIGSPGMLAVRFKLNNPQLENELVMGTAGCVAIYTRRGKPIHLVSMIAIRMQAWEYYLFPR